jgi:hypothetical protein
MEYLETVTVELAPDEIVEPEEGEEPITEEEVVVRHQGIPYGRKESEFESYEMTAEESEEKGLKIIAEITKNRGGSWLHEVIDHGD